MLGGTELAGHGGWRLRALAGQRLQGTRERERGEGKGRGAHGGDDGTLGEVGDGPEPTNLTVMAGGSQVEDEPGEVVRGLLEGRGLVRWVEDGVAELVG